MKAIMKIVIGVFIIMNLQLIYLEAFPSTSLTIDEPTELNTDFELLTPVERQKRFAMFFGMMSYENKDCVFDEHRNGTCMEPTECHSVKGKSRPGNSCTSQGAVIGVCCLVDVTCGGVVSNRNNTIFVNPGYPNNVTEPQTCDLTVPVNKACFIRLDFLNFTMYQPLEGSCLVDQFYIPELARSVPMLCGNNNGSHMYLDVRGLPQITIRINLGEWGGRRNWMIRIARIECGAPEEPPTGCLQYYQEPTGLIRSFNFNEQSPENSTLSAGLDYTICVRRTPTKCYAAWSAPFFSLSPANRTEGALVGDACARNSRITIAEGYDLAQRNATYDRYCGEIFSARPGSMNSTFVYTTSFPFHVRVKTTRSSLRETLGKGFKLRYTQLQCLDLPLAGSVGREIDSDSSLTTGSLETPEDIHQSLTSAESDDQQGEAITEAILALQDTINNVHS